MFLYTLHIHIVKLVTASNFTWILSTENVSPDSIVDVLEVYSHTQLQELSKVETHLSALLNFNTTSSNIGGQDGVELCGKVLLLRREGLDLLIRFQLLDSFQTLLISCISK